VRPETRSFAQNPHPALPTILSSRSLLPWGPAAPYRRKPPGANPDQREERFAGSGDTAERDVPAAHVGTWTAEPCDSRDALSGAGEDLET